MVDRITPASTEQTFADAERLTGRTDLAAVETEPFSQWIIEDDFVAGRPDWEAGGALFMGDVAPYEKMKLRMLNGAHSMLAYAGFIAGHRYVRDCMADPDLASLIRRHMSEAARTLAAVPGIDLGQYAGDSLDAVRQSGDRPRDLADRHGRHAKTAAAADRAGNDRARSRACRWNPMPSPWRPGCATPSA